MVCVIIIAETIIMLFLAIKYWSLKVGLMATIAWMEENKMPLKENRSRRPYCSWWTKFWMSGEMRSVRIQRCV